MGLRINCPPQYLTRALSDNGRLVPAETPSPDQGKGTGLNRILPSEA